MPRLIRCPAREPSSISEAAERIKDGRLVAFPTETVYGLGANGLDGAAISRIFEAKQRPRSDPCILHILEASDAECLFQATEEELKVYRVLSHAFWPGPLSLVLNADISKVPSEARSGGPTVAVRVPRHSVARALIAEAGVPIAAPSANKFGKISPTRAVHVAEAFADDDVMLLEEDRRCEVALESSVVQISRVNCRTATKEASAVRVTLIRRGFITESDLKAVFSCEMLPQMNTSKRASAVTPPGPNERGRYFADDRLTPPTVAPDAPIDQIIGVPVIVSSLPCAATEGLKGGTHIGNIPDPEAEVTRARASHSLCAAPGTALTHYSPRVPCLLGIAKQGSQDYDLPAPRRVVVIDLGLEIKTGAACILRPGGTTDSHLFQACFDLLHDAQRECLKRNLAGIVICLPDTDEFVMQSERRLAVLDRLYKSASGKVIWLDLEEGTGHLKALHR